MFELAKNVVSKNLIVLKNLLKKVFELFSYYQILAVKATCLLIQLLNHFFLEK